MYVSASFSANKMYVVVSNVPEYSLTMVRNTLQVEINEQGLILMRDFSQTRIGNSV